MQHKNPIVGNHESINVKTKLSGDGPPAQPVADHVDRDRLTQAVADHRQAVADKEVHHVELNNLQTQIRELTVEIVRLQSLMRDFELANDSIDLEDIRDFANRKQRANHELETLIEVRDKLKLKYEPLERDYYYNDSISIQSSINSCWLIVYDGLLKSVDNELLEQLFAVGAKIGKYDKLVINDMNLMNPVKSELLEPLAQQYGIPA